MSRTPYQILTGLDPNSIEHAVALAVTEYACDLVESDSVRALSVLRLAARLRENAHEIDSGGETSPEMEALLSAASITEDDEHPALYWVRAVTDDISED